MTLTLPRHHASGLWILPLQHTATCSEFKPNLSKNVISSRRQWDWGDSGTEKFMNVWSCAALSENSHFLPYISSRKLKQNLPGHFVKSM
jgi:hypothetical protein